MKSHELDYNIRIIQEPSIIWEDNKAENGTKAYILYKPWSIFQPYCLLRFLRSEPQSCLAQAIVRHSQSTLEHKIIKV